MGAVEEVGLHVLEGDFTAVGGPGVGEDGEGGEGGGGAGECGEDEGVGVEEAHRDGWGGSWLKGEFMGGVGRVEAGIEVDCGEIEGS